MDVDPNQLPILSDFQTNSQQQNTIIKYDGTNDGYKGIGDQRLTHQQQYSSGTFSQPMSMLIKSQFQTGYNSRGPIESREDHDEVEQEHSEQFINTGSESRQISRMTQQLELTHTRHDEEEIHEEGEVEEEELCYGEEEEEEQSHGEKESIEDIK